ncbi:GNAT family N-acetyltransferase [Leucobacter sp.]
MSGRILDRVATPEEHAALAAAVGWQSHFDDRVRAASLEASLAGVVCVVDGEAVGMARAVGDGLQYAYVQDVIVHPDHDGGGIATALVERLIELLRPAPGAELFVGLFASDEAVGVYESLGFTRGGAIGMHRRLSAGGAHPSPP